MVFAKRTKATWTVYLYIDCPYCGEWQLKCMNAWIVIWNTLVKKMQIYVVQNLISNILNKQQHTQKYR